VLHSAYQLESKRYTHAQTLTLSPLLCLCFLAILFRGFCVPAVFLVFGLLLLIIVIIVITTTCQNHHSHHHKKPSPSLLLSLSSLSSVSINWYCYTIWDLSTNAITIIVSITIIVIDMCTSSVCRVGGVCRLLL
jgi:uncharacterized membrane protein YoaK (UPF0700 family)